MVLRVIEDFELHEAAIKTGLSNKNLFNTSWYRVKIHDLLMVESALFL
jgi:hypothetical protein